MAVYTPIEAHSLLGRLLHRTRLQQQRSIAHHPRITPYQEEEVTLLVHRQLHPGTHQAVKHGRPLQIEPTLQRQLTLPHCRTEGHVRGTPQGELEHRTHLGEGDGALSAEEGTDEVGGTRRREDRTEGFGGAGAEGGTLGGGGRVEGGLFAEAENGVFVCFLKGGWEIKIYNRDSFFWGSEVNIVI